jgi:hypothetical protein
MKKYLLFIFLLLIVTKNNAQEILKNVPAVPTNVCNASMETQKQFEEKIPSIISDLESQARALKKQSKPDEAKAKAEQMLKQQGLSQEDIDKMKSKNMTKEEKQAMADKMMQQHTNMSMSEVNSMKNMSKEGKQAYMEAYASEAQAVARANGQNNNSQSMHTNNAADVISQRSVLYQKIKAQQQEVLLRYQQVEQDAEGLKIVEKMNSLHTRVKQLVGAGGEGGWIEKDKKEYDAAIATLNQLKKDYCQQMTPLYISALQNHLANLKTSYNDYLEIDKMTGEIDNAIINTGSTWNGGTLEYFDWVETYLNHLKEVYKYFPYTDY